MNKIIALILSIGFVGNGFCQIKKIVALDSSYNVLNEVSYFWRLDSLGQNGYRLCTHDRLLKAELDKVTLQEVLEKLGKPNHIKKDNTGNYYCYYYFNGVVIPKRAGYSEERLFLAFIFDFKSPYLKNIYNGHDD